MFRQVVDAGSFVAASRRMGLSAPAVSKTIAELEARLGVRLIQRSTRRMSLTEAGIGYLEDVRRILDQLDEADRALGPMQAEPSGLLRVTAPMTVSLTVLSRAIPAFLRRYPAVELDLDLNDRRVDLIGEGYDLGIRVTDPHADGSLIARKLHDLDYVLVAAPAYWQAHGVPASPAGLRGEDGIRFPWSARTDRWAFRKGDRIESVRVRARYSVGSAIAIRDALLEGFGFCMLPRIYIAGEIASGRLVPVLDDWVSPSTGLFAVYPSRRHMAPKLRAFIDFVAAQFAAII